LPGEAGPAKFLGMKKMLALPLLALPAFAQTAPPQKPPTCAGAEHHQFDFWIGSWSVKDASGATLGENRIEAIQNGCALRETWTGAKGGTGTSLNFWDRDAKKWHQTWISGNGGPLYLDGAFTGSKMVLTGERPSEKGVAKHRISWEPLPDGRVRQVWDTSTDGGKSWTNGFDGFYAKKS
jgi:hypothetical protein